MIYLYESQSLSLFSNEYIYYDIEEAKKIIESIKSLNIGYINPSDPYESVLINTLSKNKIIHIASFMCSRCNCIFVRMLFIFF
jgi:hypothetical protein